ncbi:hypothetical protein L6164_008198 [Bauhinia variegata]|uniref:Uncharacterized protein n=1 Tax=Bauhinia variegata TaxID=167791 RepID=A0ACB9PEZ7_BAUVA|nr:hypothetical protein L6164_008198 [Bauhinia variegata]
MLDLTIIVRDLNILFEKSYNSFNYLLKTLKGSVEFVLAIDLLNCWYCAVDEITRTFDLTCQQSGRGTRSVRLRFGASF